MTSIVRIVTCALYSQMVLHQGACHVLLNQVVHSQLKKFISIVHSR